MLQLISLVINENTDACMNTTFEQPYDGKTYRQIMRLAQKGFEQYINQNMQYANTYIAQAIIPDISLNLGGMKMTLQDIVFADSQFPNANVQTNPDTNSLYFSMLGVNFTLEFQFSIQQQSYPYISDKGSGQIILQNAQITGDIHEYISQGCQGAEQVNCSDFSIYINQLLITLQSPNSYIYNGIIQLISSSLLQIFNTDLQNVLQDAFLDVANQGIQSGELTAAPYGDQNNTVEDQRFVDIIVGQGYFDSMTMGTMCFIADNVCTGSIQLSDDFPQPGSWGTNNDAQYLQSSDTYLSQFQVLYQQDMFDYKQNQQCDNVEFVNTGVVFTCYLQVEEQDIEVNFLAPIYIYDVTVKSSLQELSIYEQISTWEIVKGQVSDSVMENVVENINNVLKYNAPGINNGNFVNDKGCYYKRWSNWWMQISCNFDGSFN